MHRPQGLFSVVDRRVAQACLIYRGQCPCRGRNASLVSEPDAITFLVKYDTIPLAEVGYLSLDEICCAAGVDGPKLLSIALDSMMQTGAYIPQINCSMSLLDITRATIKRALTPKGWRDAQLIMKKIGVVPQ
jgi:hypothetical protein